MNSSKELEWLNLEIQINEAYNNLLISSIENNLYNNINLNEDYINDKVEGTKKFVKKTVKNTIDVATNKKFKDFWLGIWEKIKTLWHNFVTKIDVLIKNKSGIVNKYQKEITTIDISNVEFTEVYPYWNGANLLNKTSIPDFNLNNKKLMDALENESTFIHEFFPYLGISGNEENVIQSIKNKFRGSETPINFKGASLKSKISNMIEFNMQYKSVKNKLQSDYKNIEKCVKTAIKNYENNNINESFLFSESNKQDIKNKYKVFTLTCQKILGIKQTILEERFLQNDKIFRQILKSSTSSIKTSKNNEIINNDNESKTDNKPKFTTEFGSKDYNSKRVKELSLRRKELTNKLTQMGEHVKLNKLSQGDSVYDSLAKTAQGIHKEIAEIDNELYAMGVETLNPKFKDKLKNAKKKILKK